MDFLMTFMAPFMSECGLCPKGQWTIRVYPWRNLPSL